jgi:hypothetical protein
MDLAPEEPTFEEVGDELADLVRVANQIKSERKWDKEHTYVIDIIRILHGRRFGIRKMDLDAALREKRVMDQEPIPKAFGKIVARSPRSPCRWRPAPGRSLWLSPAASVPAKITNEFDLILAMYTRRQRSVVRWRRPDGCTESGQTLGFLARGGPPTKISAAKKQKASKFTWANNYGTILPLSVLSGALKIADKVTVAMEAVGDKISLNSQGWGESSASARVLMVEAHKGQLYLLPEHRPAKFQRIDNHGLHEAGYGPDDFE